MSRRGLVGRDGLLLGGFDLEFAITQDDLRSSRSWRISRGGCSVGRCRRSLGIGVEDGNQVLDFGANRGNFRTFSGSFMLTVKSAFLSVLASSVTAT